MTRQPDTHPGGASGSILGDGDTEPPEPAARAALVHPFAIDVVLDEADWSAFGDVEAAVMAAGDALGGIRDLDVAGAGAVIALSSDAEVAALNGTYRGNPSPTNVLSFPAAIGPAGRCAAASTPLVRPLGDIILARETVLREAAGQGISPVHHLQHLVVHGLLHLLGYDHETGRDADAMEALEVRILAGLGIADPYGEAPAPREETPHPK